MISYIKGLRTILTSERAFMRQDRTGVGTVGVFGFDITHDMGSGFPLLTTKKMFFRGVFEELMWMLRGETNVKELQKRDVHIWDEWADERGDLGPTYGYLWRDFEGVDQVEELVEGLINNPNSRRHIVTGWNPSLVPDQKLPPCHCFMQVNMRPPGSRARARSLLTNEALPPRGIDPWTLDLRIYQRSCDYFLGVPFNVAQYGLYMELLCATLCVRGHHTIPGTLTWSGGDVHLYMNHLDAAREQLDRTVMKLPRVTVVNPRPLVWDYTWEDISLEGYESHPAIKAEVAV